MTTMLLLVRSTRRMVAVSFGESVPPVRSAQADKRIADSGEAIW